MPPAALDLSTTVSPAVAAVLAGLGIVLVVVLVRELRQVPARLLVLMATAFVDMIGLFMVVPILPFYVQAFGAGGTEPSGHGLGAGTLTGLVVSSFTVAQLVSAPWWGRASDRWGRRPVLLIALAASAAAFLLFGFAESLWMLVLSRVVQGAGGGTVGVIQAYVADAVEPAQRARALGWLSAATNLGVALGPVLGSVAVMLGDADLWPGEGALVLGRAAPGLAAALLCGANVVLAWVWLREPTAPGTAPAAAAPAAARTSPFVAAGRVLAQPRLPASRLLLIYAIAIGAAQGANPTLVLFVGERHGADERTIGYLFMYIGTLSVFARLLLLGQLVDRLGEVRLSRVGIVTLTCGLAALPFTHSLGELALAVAMLPLGMALTFPCLTSLLSRVVPGHERGMWMGLQQTFGGVARLLAPVAYGVVYDQFGAGAPFWLAAGVVAVTLLLGIGLARAAGAVAGTGVPPRL